LLDVVIKVLNRIVKLLFAPSAVDCVEFAERVFAGKHGKD